MSPLDEARVSRMQPGLGMILAGTVSHSQETISQSVLSNYQGLVRDSTTQRVTTGQFVFDDACEVTLLSKCSCARKMLFDGTQSICKDNLPVKPH